MVVSRRFRALVAPVIALVASILAAPSGAGAATDPPAHVVLTPTTSPATSQYFTWRSSEPATSQRVDVWPAAGGPWRRATVTAKPKPSVRNSGTSLRAYRARIDGLTPGTAYAYRIKHQGSTMTGRFTTASRDGGSWRFLALGDTQVDNAGVPAAIVKRAAAAVPDARLLLHAGDVVNHPWVGSEWRDLMIALRPLRTRINVLASIGNHEQCILLRTCRSGHAEAFRHAFTFPSNGYPKQRSTWFSTDYQGVRFVVLDSFGPDLDRQAAFLQGRLCDNPQRWSVVLMHAGPFSSRADRTNSAVYSRIRPVLERCRADLVLTGHDHVYSRGYRGSRNSTVYATSDSGPKYYVASSKDWTRRGATREVWAQNVSTYQVVEVDGSTLRYRAVVARNGSGAKPSKPVGSVLDAVTITKDEAGAKTVTW
ncbi:MAG: metallophosphoesterase family protein [Aeromicrobium erythreum]